MYFSFRLSKYAEQLATQAAYELLESVCKRVDVHMICVSLLASRVDLKYFLSVYNRFVVIFYLYARQDFCTTETRTSYCLEALMMHVSDAGDSHRIDLYYCNVALAPL